MGYPETADYIEQVKVELRSMVGEGTQAIDEVASLCYGRVKRAARKDRKAQRRMDVSREVDEIGESLINLPYGVHARHNRFTSESELDATLPPDREQLSVILASQQSEKPTDALHRLAISNALAASRNPEQVDERRDRARHYANGFGGNQVMACNLLDYDPSSPHYVPEEHVTEMMRNYIATFGGWAIDVASGIVGVWKVSDDPTGNTSQISFKTAWQANYFMRHIVPLWLQDGQQASGVSSSVFMPAVSLLQNEHQLAAQQQLRPTLNYLYEHHPYLRPHFVNTQIRVTDHDGDWYVTVQDLVAAAPQAQYLGQLMAAGLRAEVPVGAGDSGSPVPSSYYRELMGSATPESPTKLMKPPPYDVALSMPTLQFGGEPIPGLFPQSELLQNWLMPVGVSADGLSMSCNFAARSDMDMGENGSAKSDDSGGSLLDQILGLCEAAVDSGTAVQQCMNQCDQTPSDAVTPENSPQDEIGAPSQGTPTDNAFLISPPLVPLTSPLTPIVCISIEGLIGAGKSSALELARSALEGMGFTVHQEPIMTFYPEIVKLFYNHPDRYAFEIQRAAIHSYSQVKVTPFMIIERSPDASVDVFATNLKINGLLTQEQLRELKAARNKLSWEPTAHIHVDTPPDVCLQRIAARQREGEGAVTSNLLWDHAFLYGNMYGSLLRDVHFIDGEDSMIGVAEEIIRIASQYVHTSHTAEVEHPLVPVIMTRTTVSGVKRRLDSTFGAVINTATPAAKKSEREVPPAGSTDQEMTDVAGAGTSGVSQGKKEGSLGMITRFFRPKLMSIPEPVPEVVTISSSTSDDLTEPSEGRFTSGGSLGDGGIQVPNWKTVAEVDAITCCRCERRDEAATMLLCDRCNVATHCACLVPPLPSVPVGSWICDTCSKAAVGKDTLDITDDTWTMEYLKSGKLPVFSGGQDKYEHRKLCKRIRRRSKGYIVVGNVLHRGISRTYATPRRVPLVSERPNLIRMCHDEVGHYGVSRTLFNLSKRFFWPGLSRDVKDYVARCNSCQYEKAAFKEKTNLHPLPIVDRLGDRVSVDLVGPLVLTQDKNCYLITCIDGYTKWVIASPLPNKLSRTVAEWFHSQVICKIGCPGIVRTDQGTEFKFEFDQLLERYGIKHQISSAYNPEANGAIERLNATIIHSIRRSMEAHDPTMWDVHVDNSVFGYNITKQSSTQFSPYFLVYGREARLPCEGQVVGKMSTEDTAVIVPPTAEPPPRPLPELPNSEAVHKRLEEADTARLTAVKNMESAQLKQCREYNRRRPMDKDAIIATGSLVLVKGHKDKGKLVCTTEGPYLLVAYNKERTMCKLRDHAGKEWTDHASHIQEYEHPTGGR